jgi:hypothetical protein
MYVYDDDSAISACNITYFYDSLGSMMSKLEISTLVLWGDFIINIVLLMAFL